MKRNKLKNKAFTLIELLAVIVILSVIALIAIPITLNIIDNVKKESYKTSIESAIRSAELYIANNTEEDISKGIDITKLFLKNNNFTSGKVYSDNKGKTTADKLTNGEFCGGATADGLRPVIDLYK